MRSFSDRKSEMARPQTRAAWAESFQPVLAELRQELWGCPPEQVAAAAGADWQPDTRELRLLFLEEEIRIPWSDLVACPVRATAPCPANLQGLFLYYLAKADGTPLAERWISFRELPDGWLYHQAFHGYTGQVLVQALGNDVSPLVQAAAAAGGKQESFGDVGYRFDILPRVRLAVVYWLGDEEFPPRAQVLFDEAAGHYLPIDGLAMLGSHLIRCLLRGRS
jgi:hypothetical protein